MAIAAETSTTDLASDAAPGFLVAEPPHASTRAAELRSPDAQRLAPADDPSTGALPRWLKPNRFSDSIAIMLVLTAVQRLVGFGRSVLFCMFLSPFELGQWDIAFGFLLLAAPVAVLSLPAAFGRYVEYYRLRGELRTFLRRIAAVTVTLAVIATAAIVFFADRFSIWIFGTPGDAALVRLIAATLLANIMYNVVTELFVALRMQRIASGMELVLSVGFAAIGLALVVLGENRATSLVIAYGAACLAALVASSAWLWNSCREMTVSAAPTAALAFWSKLIPFVAWVWISNWLVNLFVFVDRYMVVHFSGLPNEAATALVGQYHSSRLVPQLLVTVAAVLSGVAIPFFSRDWELGELKRLSARLNMLVKLTGLALFAGATVVLAAGPLLFGTVFRGRFNVGLEVLPGTLLYSTWFGVISIMRVYLWCAERVRMVCLAYLAGLIVNIGLNLILVPQLGLLGAVLGTCAAHVVALAIIYATSIASGLHIDRGVWIISVLPLVLLLGPWASVAASIVAAVISVGTNLILTSAERHELLGVVLRYCSRRV